MASAIEILKKQALKTFTGRRNVEFKLCQKNFDKLWGLMNKITAGDVNLNQQVLDLIEIQPAPMRVIDIFENDDLTILIFVLKHGVTMPMHDHPGMHGFLKVIKGTVQLNSYTLKENNDHIIKLNKEIEAFRHRPISLHSSSPACVLTPKEKNLHEISCIEGPAAFLDILSPPYDEDGTGRGLKPWFFKTISSTACTDVPDVIESVKLLAFEGLPNFDSKSLIYTGSPPK